MYVARIREPDGISGPLLLFEQQKRGKHLLMYKNLVGLGSEFSGEKEESKKEIHSRSMPWYTYYVYCGNCRPLKQK